MSESNEDANVAPDVAPMGALGAANPVTGYGAGARGTHADALVANPEPLAGETIEGSSEPMKSANLRTVEDLLRYAYGQAGKRFSLPLAVLEKLSNRPSDVDALRPLVRQLAESDPLVAVPPRLMIAVEQHAASGSFKRLVAELMAAAMRINPVFDEPSIAAVIAGSVTDPADAFAALAHRTRSVADSAEGRASLKATDLHKLRHNAMTSLAILLSITQKWSLDDIVDALDAGLWQPERRSHKGQTPRALLFDSRTPETLGVVTDVFARRLRQAETKAQEADRFASWSKQQAAEAAHQLEQTESQLADVQRQVAHLQREVERLNQQIVSERDNRAADHTHHAADYEALRTRILRMLTKERALLEDGLHAVQNGRPHIAEEFMERVIDKLRAESDQLGGRS